MDRPVSGIEWAERGFCTVCKSQMFYRRDDLPMISIAPGAFDCGDILTVSGQIYAHSHLSWGPVGADLPDLDKNVHRPGSGE